MTNVTQVMSEYKFIKDYAQWLDQEKRYETWEEAVDRVMDMHRVKYADKMTPELEEYLTFAREAYNEKLVLASQRSLQFGGKPLLKREERVYNCLVSYCDRPRFFQEAMHWLLCGGGVGFSVQDHHIAKLSKIKQRDLEPKTFVISDSIEGWADAVGVLLSSFFSEGQTFPEYSNHRIDFDFSQIRPKGALISGGYKAPGPSGLRNALINIENLLQQVSDRKLKPIECYDIVMYMSDAVLSGGVRRSATICQFTKTNKEMLEAKTGNWFIENPQRGRSNNSAMLVRSETTKEEFLNLFGSIKEFGEPGLIWTDNSEIISNPCVEIGFMPISPRGVSSWSGCNLTEVNGGKLNNIEIAKRAIKAATILGTLQAGFTNFTYCDQETIDTFKKEALLGVSITGWMEQPKFLFDEILLKELADYAKQINAEVAVILGINPAARITCTKPSGNASVLLETSSGIHPHHSKRYFRNIQGNKEEDIVQAFARVNPAATEESVWSEGKTDLVLSFPITAPRGSLFKKDLEGTKLLDYVKLVQNSWVENGTNIHLCNHPNIRHNVSNTITVDDWDKVAEYVWDNKENFAGISFLPPSGDKDYPQAPFTEVKTAEEILEEYGTASMLASGLVVDGLHAFNNDLWKACSFVLDKQEDTVQKNSDTVLQLDWVRRCKKFCRRYFKGDMVLMCYCLKDIHLLHKWETVTKSFKAIDWLNEDISPKYKEADEQAGVACQGGVCETSF